MAKPIEDQGYKSQFRSTAIHPIAGIINRYHIMNPSKCAKLNIGDKVVMKINKWGLSYFHVGDIGTVIEKFDAIGDLPFKGVKIMLRHDNGGMTAWNLFQEYCEDFEPLDLGKDAEGEYTSKFLKLLDDKKKVIQEESEYLPEQSLGYINALREVAKELFGFDLYVKTSMYITYDVNPQEKVGLTSNDDAP